MKAVIMAGGESTRLRPLTCMHPKPLVPVLDRPVMEYIVELLKSHGFTDIIVTLFYLPDAIQAHFGNGSQFGVKMRYFVEEFPLGTAGSVRNAKKYLDDTFLVISGDTLTDIDLSRVVEYHREKKAIATLALSKVDNPLEYGVVMTDEEGKITRFLEKPSWAEVFSDTVNTGIYVLEPEIFDYFDDKQVFDFSKDLFPLLMAKNQPLYATLCPEYWCDIGSLHQYRQANYDLLSGNVKAKIQAPEIKEGIFIGEGASIEDTAILEKPCYIGPGARIKEGARIGAGSVIGRGCNLNEGVSIKRSILWDKVYAGKKAELRGAIACNNVVLKTQSTILEGAVIGDESVLGSKSHVQMDVRIWPEKNIEAGSNINSNVIWGTRLSKFLFGSRGVSGVINLEITPEFASKLGAAYGTVIGQGKSVAVSCDTAQASRMLKRSFISGVLSTGANVYDMGTTTSGTNRYIVRLLQADGGVHLRIIPEDNTALRVEFYDTRGFNIHKNTERKIENIFAREGFSRVGAENIGQVAFLTNVIAQYLDGVLRSTDFKAIYNSKFRVALYYDTSNVTSVLPILLEKLGCEVITPDDLSVRHGTRTLDDIAAGLESLKNCVSKNHADLGVLLDQDAERMILVDEHGNIITEEQLLTLISYLLLKFTSGRAITIPVTAPKLIMELAQEYDGWVLQSRAGNPGMIVESVSENRVLFEGDEIPEFQMMCDSITSLVKVLELMARERMRLSELVATMPAFSIYKQDVHCPVEEKGKVMRLLVEEFKDNQLELTQGIKILHNEGWSLIMPDDEEPVFTIYTEAASLEKANEITQRYVGMINQMRVLDGKLEIGGMAVR
ncbi:MAG: sugar phosphate nucleotidyltransferase [Chitinophagales bacterium]